MPFIFVLSDYLQIPLDTIENQWYQSAPLSFYVVNRPLPKKAAAAIRQLIVDCLKDNRYRVYSDGQRYLNIKDIRVKHIIEDLIYEIENYHIFELPTQPGSLPKNSRQKYQYVIKYNNPELFVHVKMTPADCDPPTVFLGFHSHNTGAKPLPQNPLTPTSPSHENKEQPKDPKCRHPMPVL